MRGQPILTYTTNAIFRCKNFWDLHDKKKGYRFIFIGPEGTWSTIVAIDGYDRFRFSVVGDETKRTLSENKLRILIRRAMGRNFDFESLSVVPWIRRELVADGYGKGRVFIAGDAAHLNSPTGAFGMNTGMQDSVDLGWKLAAILQGWGGKELLHTYEIERRPVALRNIKEASENLRRMISPRQTLTRQVFESGPEGDAARKVFGDAYTEMMRREWFTLHIHLGYRYDDSPIIVGDGTPAYADPVMTYNQTARPGGRAPHVWLARGKSTLDLFGRGFVLLRFVPLVPTLTIEAAAQKERVPLEVIDIDDDHARTLYEAKLVLVRPDGFVAWRGESVPPDADALINTVRGEYLPRSNPRVLALQKADAQPVED
jgi:hypothetical protein